ncbi:Homeodomain-like superfamily protein [Perilla frutescens var. hirtella]|nr:Homeodomain-like superfamily protein [Perilla frutescens var. hirtella]
MMASPSELNFDCKPQIFSMLQKSFGDQTSEQTQKLEEFLSRLEEERLKIDAFKRELPLCMQLLTNAMEASRQQLQSERANNQAARPVLEEFIPMKNSNSPNVEINEGNIAADKANWMTSAQLWNQESEGVKTPLPQSPLTISTQESDIKLALNGKQRINGGGAFLPFSSRDRGSPPSGEGFPELALASSHNEEMEDKRNSSVEKEQAANTAQTHRKARRCWSPDLHRRFVNALHMLGGSQVATPKQIRELMKVDGLTNDEVKSHLQKYRLHTRRPSPSPQAAVTAAPQVVVLGGIWVPPEYAAAAAAHGGAQTAALYGAHHPATTHPNFPQGPQDQMPPVMQRNSSPESDMQGGGGDPSESIEDGKSESGSWKADSGGDNSGERRRVEGEESNASVVSLKF